MVDIKGFLEATKRIFTVSKKPTSEEFWTMAKITGLGIIFLAIIGFIITLIMKILQLGK